jgi:hypothetical protein
VIVVVPFSNERPFAKKIGSNNIYVCGGGRKNKFLINSLKSKINNKIFNPVELKKNILIKELIKRKISTNGTDYQL